MQRPARFPVPAVLAVLLILGGCASDAEKADRARVLYEEAKLLHENHEFEAERDKYDEVVALNAEDARAWFKRGTTYLYETRLPENDDRQRELYDKAIEQFTEAIRLQPKIYASAYYNRGECNRQLYSLSVGNGDEEKYLRRAMNDYHKAIEINRDHAKAHKAMGYLAHFVLQPRKAKYKAIGHYRRYLEIVGEDAQIQQWLDKLLSAYGDPVAPKPQPAMKPTPDPKKEPAKQPPPDDDSSDPYDND